MEKKEITRRKRILVATGLYPPDMRGPATYSKILNDKLPDYGFDVVVLPFARVRHLPKVFRHISYFFKVMKLGKTADLIYAQDPVSVGFPSMLAARFLKKRFVLKVVGDYIWEQGVQRFKVTETLDEFSHRTTGFPLYLGFLKYLQTKTAEAAQIIITPSNYLKKIVSNWGISKDKIKVIYNSFDFVDKNGTKEELRKFLYLDGLVLFSVGALVPWKGFDVLIELMPELLSRYPKLQLLIAGEGPDREKLKALIKAKKLDTRVALLGRLPQEALFKYIKASDIFILNTSYEGLSHQLLEVMALGVPIVTTNIGGNPELIGAGEEGILLEPNNKDELRDAISYLLNNPNAGKKLVQNAQKKVKSFNEDNMLRSLARELL